VPRVVLRYGAVVPGVGYVGPGEEIDIDGALAAAFLAQSLADPAPAREVAVRTAAVEQAVLVAPPRQRRKGRKGKRR